jgi:hypothetical protein
VNRTASGEHGVPVTAGLDARGLAAPVYDLGQKNIKELGRVGPHHRKTLGDIALDGPQVNIPVEGVVGVMDDLGIQSGNKHDNKK